MATVIDHFLQSHFVQYPDSRDLDYSTMMPYSSLEADLE
jgi:hypothetical protein